MIKCFAASIVAVALGAVGLGFAAIKSGIIPANADTAPGRLETWIAQTSLKATIERQMPRGANPVVLTDDNLLAGIGLYAKNCAVCHGGPKGSAAVPPVAQGLYPSPPQLASDGVEDDPEGESFWKIKHGIRLTGMPSWSKTLSDQQIWTLALFLKHMDKLPPAAKAEWEKLN